MKCALLFFPISPYALLNTQNDGISQGLIHSFSLLRWQLPLPQLGRRKQQSHRAAAGTGQWQCEQHFQQ